MVVGRHEHEHQHEHHVAGSDSGAEARGARPLDAHAHRAAFLLGGIGTGNVSLGARGELRDWELESAPDKGRVNPLTFFAVHVRPAGGEPVSRVLEARLTGRHDWDAGYGFDQLAGLPRFASSTMRGRYPVVDVDLVDDAVPVAVTLRAFTPLVPLDADDSGIPAAVLRYRVRNTGPVAAQVTVVGSLTHTAGRGEGPWGMRATQSVRQRDEDGVRGLYFDVDLPHTDPGYGTMALTTTDASTTCKPQWVTGFWPDGARLFWTDLTTDGLLDPEPRPTLEDRPRGLFAEGATDGEMTQEQVLAALPRHRTGSLGIVHDLAPGEERDFEFVLSWCYPHRRRGWFGNIVHADPRADEVVAHRHATRWPDAWSAATYLHTELDRLEGATTRFVEDLYDSSLDPVVAQSVGANVAALRSTTCFVLETPVPELGPGPVFAAWEGSFDHVGSCEGTCTHVWSYAQTVAWLFPSLERSARRVELLLETDEAGAQKFRTNRVLGGPAWFMGPAVDGQLGTFVRVHREWRFSGDDDFLREVWPAAARTLDHALREWDRDGDGLLDGELHNTYDIEFHGVEPLANGMLLVALRAGVRMAEHLGESATAARWSAAADRAADAMSTVLWNGEYFRQVLDDVDAHRYQYGEGVLSDQLLGQFHAFVNGLGLLLPRDQVHSAVTAVVRHNFREDLRGLESTQRVYALNDEGGLLLASWPHGGRPAIPFVYSDEVWTGVEHQVAATLAYLGETAAALRIERAVRARYDGVARNPWNEIECGNHYARSMSSWALLLAYSGVQWDGPRRRLELAPPTGEYRGLFTTGAAWGHVDVGPAAVTLTVRGGALDLAELVVAGVVVARDVRVDGTRTFPVPGP